jgi:predicted DNA-binding protein
MNRRFLIQLDAETEDRLRLLSFQTNTPLTEVVRQCIDRALPDVEKYLLQKPGLRMVNPEDIQRLRDLQRKPEGTADSLRLNLMSVPKPTEPREPKS